jgi:hypothetical protein
MGYCRVLEFVDSVKKAKEPSKVIKREVVYLRACYPVKTSLRRAFTIYRNAAKSLSESLFVECKKAFTLTAKESGILKEMANTQVANELRNLRPLSNVHGYLLKCEQLITKPTSYYDVILGLSALTGRRVAEIACTAEITVLSHDRILFKGQLKTKTRGDLPPYEIPVLCDSALIVKALAMLREKQPELIGCSELFHNRSSKALSIRVKRHFEMFFPEPKAKDLRSIYGELSYALLDDSSIAKMRYMSDILGHGVNDNLTGQSYLDFYINDETF